MTGPSVDRVTFTTSVVVMLVVCVPLIAAPEAGGDVIEAIYQWIANQLGVFYQWATLGATIFLAWLAFGRYGKRKLGDTGPDGESPDPESSGPEFSTFSWMAMLFCAGVGAGLMYWSTIEWAFYLNTPPYGIEPGSPEAVPWAASYGIFHWGLSAWCLYCFPTVAIAYPYYKKKLSHLRLSTGLHGLLGEERQDGAIARVVDLIFIVALLGGAGTSLGLATPMIAAIAGHLLGIEATFATEASIVVLCALIFAVSVYLGIHRGIKRLSDINTVAAFVLLGFVLLAGPTLFLLQMGTDSIGFMLQNFIRMNTWTDPVEHSGFVEDWTVFYWAWWIAYGPFMGIFTTRISRGRTLRELIVGMTVFGTLGCALFYVVFGDYALSLELEGVLPIREMVADGRSPEAIAKILATLPFYPLGLALFGLVAVIFAATTYDSGSYTLASAATRFLPAGTEPARWHRIFWAFALAVIPVTIMFVGGLRAAKSLVLVVSLPVLVVSVFMAVSLVKSLRQGDT